MVKKIIIILSLVIIFFNAGSCCFALEMESANLSKVGMADYHLKYNNSYVICSIVGYYNGNGEFRPAYCMNKEKPGAETVPYTVNIYSVLENDAVWRVVKNAYPYVSAGALGLSEYDAYVVTKMAIYCILGQSELSNFSADSSDGTANQMLNVLHRLVNEGINGTETRKSSSMSISKIGELTETDEYYFQEYAVASSINLKEYSVEIQNFPEGTFVSDIEGNNKKAFLKGENFRVFISKESFNKDINGTINITGKCENYPVFYGEAPSRRLSKLCSNI